MPAKRETAELLTAYVDGVGEMTVEERRRVERYLASPEARAEQERTRALLDQLRELPPAQSREPDWSALERSIADAVGDEVPRRSWFHRWRFALPAFALAAAVIAIVVIKSRSTEDEALPIAFVPKTDDTQPVFATEDERVTVYLDGTDLELALDTADAADAELDELFLGKPAPDALEDEASLGFLEPTDLAWIDDLDDDALSRAEQLLDRSLHRRKGS
jgi:hypothetical protein